MMPSISFRQTTYFVLLLCPGLVRQSQSTKKPADTTLESFGLAVEDVMDIGAMTRGKDGVTSLEVKMYWKALPPEIAEEVRQNCGADVIENALTKPISIETGGKKATSSAVSKVKRVGVNCTFTSSSAQVSLRFKNLDNTALSWLLPLGRAVGKAGMSVMRLRVNWFPGNSLGEDNEFAEADEKCVLSLGGYGNFRNVLLAYEKASGFTEPQKQVAEELPPPLQAPRARPRATLRKFPQQLFPLLMSKQEEEGSVKESGIPFNPNQGRGKRFQKTKGCLENLVWAVQGTHPKSLTVRQVIDAHCELECVEDNDDDDKHGQSDVEPAIDEQKQMEHGKTKGATRFDNEL